MPESDYSFRNDDPAVRSVQRALSILRAFRASERGLPLGEIARRAELDKATARRLLRTLMQELVIDQNRETKEYSLGMGALELLAGITPAHELQSSGLPVLATLAQATGAAATLMVLHDAAALCVAMVEGERPTPAPWSVGERLPLHADASPRVLMAFLPLESRMALLAAPLSALTPATPADAFQLSGILETIRRRGWELGADELVPGTASLGVPVRSEAGEVVAALGVAGPQSALLEGTQPRHLALVQAKARELERRLPAAPSLGGSARKPR